MKLLLLAILVLVLDVMYVDGKRCFDDGKKIECFGFEDFCIDVQGNVEVCGECASTDSAIFLRSKFDKRREVVQFSKNNLTMGEVIAVSVFGTLLFVVVVVVVMSGWYGLYRKDQPGWCNRCKNNNDEEDGNETRNI